MKKGDVCVVKLIAGVGHEQYGERPAILVSDTKTSIAIVIPLTTNLEALRFPYTLAVMPDRHNNLKHKSVALIFHMRAIDKARIKNITGRVTAGLQKRIDNITREMLGL